MTEADFIDTIESLGGTVELFFSAAVEGAKAWPTVRVTLHGKSEVWRRPTFQQAFEWATEWANDKEARHGFQ